MEKKPKRKRKLEIDNLSGFDQELINRQIYKGEFNKNGGEHVRSR